MTRTARFVALALAPLLAACAAAPATPSPGPTAPPAAVAVGQPLPALEVRDLQGHPLPLASLRGRVVLLDLWASWCAACKEELPQLDALAGRLAPRGVAVVAVSLDEDRAAAQELLAHQGDWKLQVAHDPDGQVARVLAPPKMPSSYVIDRQGVLHTVHAGFAPGDAARLEAELSALAGDGQ